MPELFVDAMAGEMDKYFSDAGFLAQVFDEFESRPQQLTMANAVYDSLTSGRRVIVEAGTGVGKSLAYLIPAALWSLQTGRQVVISTHTRALQSQLIEKDLPLVDKCLNQAGVASLSYASLMGQENYLCLQRYQAAFDEPVGLFDQGEEQAKTNSMYERALKLETGLRGKVAPRIGEDIWERVRVNPDICRRFHEHRKLDQPCAYRWDLLRAGKANLLVINHWLLMRWPIPADEPEPTGSARVRPFGAAIIDEAHNLASVASDCLGIELTERAFTDYLRQLSTGKRHGGFLQRRTESAAKLWKPRVVEAITLAQDQATKMFAELKEWTKHSDQYEEETGVHERRITEPLTLKHNAVPLFLQVAGLLEEVEEWAVTYEQGQEAVGLATKARLLCTQLQEILKAERSETVYSVGIDPKETLRLVARPLDVSEALREKYWDRPFPFAMCSASLSTKDSCEYFRRSIGIADANEVILGSPFSWEEQAACYIAGDLPDPKNADEWEQAVFERTLELIGKIKGGVLVLFTSWKMLQRADEFLLEHLDKSRELLVQGEMDSYQLLERFRDFESSILLGTATFWQGVDVPGKALECVIITRLPFPFPFSAYEKAREDWLISKGLTPFKDEALPRAILRTKQAIGRLIRKKTDRGLIAFMDPRIRTRSYGSLFRKAMPPLKYLPRMEDVQEFINGP